MRTQKTTPKALAEEFVAAEVRHDVPYMKAALAENFVSIGPHGLLLNKAEWLQRFESGNLRYSFYSIEDFEMRLSGGTAVVTALDTIRGRHGDRDVNGRFRSAHVWVRQARGWRLVLHQLTAVTHAPAPSRSKRLTPALRRPKPPAALLAP